MMVVKLIRAIKIIKVMVMNGDGVHDGNDVDDDVER